MEDNLKEKSAFKSPITIEMEKFLEMKSQIMALEGEIIKKEQEILTKQAIINGRENTIKSLELDIQKMKDKTIVAYESASGDIKEVLNEVRAERRAMQDANNVMRVFQDESKYLKSELQDFNKLQSYQAPPEYTLRIFGICTITLKKSTTN